MSEWIEWKDVPGTGMPVAPGIKVETRLRDGSKYKAQYSNIVCWYHFKRPDDVVAYRIVKEKEA